MYLLDRNQPKSICKSSRSGSLFFCLITVSWLISNCLQSRAQQAQGNLQHSSTEIDISCTSRQAPQSQPPERVTQKVLPLIQSIQEAQNRGDLLIAEARSRELTHYLRENDYSTSFPLALTQLSEILAGQSNTEEAIRLQEEALSVVKANGYSGHRFSGMVVNQLTRLYAGKGDIQKAIGIYKDFLMDSYNALACQVSMKGSPQEKTALSRFKEKALGVDDYTKNLSTPDWARPIPEAWEFIASSYYYAISLVAAAKETEATPTAALAKLLSGAGSLALSMGNAEASLSHYKEALQVLEKNKQITDADLQEIVPGIRDSYFQLKKFREARDAGMIYSEYTKKTFGASSLNYAIALQSVAHAADAIGDLEKAESIMRTTGIILNKGYYQDAQARTMESHATLLTKMGREDEALQLLKEAYAHRYRMLRSMTRKDKGVDRLSGISYVLRSAHLDSAAATAALSKGTGLKDHALRASALIKNLEVRPRNPVSHQFHDNEDTDLHSGSLKPGKAIAPAILARLSRDSAYIEILKHPSPEALRDKSSYRYIALVVDHSAALRAIDLGAATTIEGEINNILLSQAEDLHGADQIRGIRLPAFIEKMIAGNETKNVIFINPDGDFSRMPLGLISQVLREQSKTNDSPRLEMVLNPLAFEIRAQDQAAGVVAFVNPSYSETRTRTITKSADDAKEISTRSVRTFERLPYTEKEGEIVASLFNGKVIRGQSARADIFLSIKRPKVIHVAAHGYFSPDLNDAANTLSAIMGGISLRRSAASSTGIVLAPQPGSHEGYSLVTADKIAEMDLSGTELVVLSACNTGIGILGQGSALSALGAAAINAGARNVLLTLWPVDDHATALFMERFYRLYAGGLPPSEALSQTQTQFATKQIQDPDRKNEWERPYFWAGFQLMQGAVRVDH